MPRKISYHRKRLGQIFLRDPLVVERILQSASLAPDDTVLEVGPGRGILTAALAQRTQALYAIEVDAHYARTLQQRRNMVAHGVSRGFERENQEDKPRKGRHNSSRANCAAPAGAGCPVCR